MSTCFCFSKKAFRRTLNAETARQATQHRVPPEVTGRVESSATEADDVIYNLAKLGKAQELKRLLEKARKEKISRWLSCVDDSNRTPLIIATKEGHVDCIKTLIEYGADVMHMSCRRDEGTALHVAAKKKLSPRIIYCLLSKGANPFVENSFRITPWDLAKQNANWAAVNIFSNHGLFRKTLPMQVGGGEETTSARDVCIFPRYEWNLKSRELHRIGKTLYFCSLGPTEDHSDVDLNDAQAEFIQEETEDLATVLLTFPASRARLARDLLTRVRVTSALMHIWIPRWAAWSLREFADIVNQKDELRSVNPSRGNPQDDLDKRIINWIREQTASQCFDPEVDDLIEKTSPDEVYRKSQSGDYRALEPLLSSLTESEKIRALSWEDMDGNTPLMVSTEKDHLKCVRLLLEHGANVYHCSQREDGGTALHIAVSNGVSDDVVRTLLTYHANPLVENSSRVTASDLCGDARDLMLREDLLFHEVMSGNLSAEGIEMDVGDATSFLVLIAPRFACCHRPQDLHRISKTLHVYHAVEHEPLVEIDLYEASARVVTQEGHDQQQVLLSFPRKALLTCNWSNDEYVDDADLVEVHMSFDSTVESCSRFVKIINIEDGLQLAPSIKSIWKESRQLRGSSSSSALTARQRSQDVSFLCPVVPCKENGSVSDVHCQNGNNMVQSDDDDDDV